MKMSAFPGVASPCNFFTPALWWAFPTHPQQHDCLTTNKSLLFFEIFQLILEPWYLPTKKPLELFLSFIFLLCSGEMEPTVTAN